MKKRIISVICLIGCVLMAAGVSVQAGEKESEPALVTNEWEEIIIMEGDCTMRSMSDPSVHFDNGVFEIEYIK